VQARISRERLARKVGRKIEVLVDEVQKSSVIGRSAADAPEIDGVVRVKGAKGVNPGDFVHALVTSAKEHDLEAIVAPA